MLCIAPSMIRKFGPTAHKAKSMRKKLKPASLNTPAYGGRPSGSKIRTLSQPALGSRKPRATIKIAVAGMMVAPIVYLDPNMMGGVLLYAFAAALVGGIDNPAGAVFGGFLVGVLENVLGAFVIGNELKLAVALVLIIGVLVVRPSGFFGKVHVSRV